MILEDHKNSYLRPARHLKKAFLEQLRLHAKLFVPNQNGRVVTNTRLEAIMNNALNRATTGEGGGGTTVINAPTNAVTTNSQTHSSPNAVRNNDPFFQRIAGFAI